MYNDIYPPLWYNTQQFRCPKNLLYSIPPIYPSLPIATALATTNLFTVFIVLLFLECYIVGLIQYITSSACSFNLLVCISFHGQMAHFFFFFLIIFFINALIFCSSGSLLLCRLFSSCRGQGYSLVVGGFSLRWLLLLQSKAVGPVGFSSCGTQAQQAQPPGARAQAQPLWHMDLALQHVGSSPTGDRAHVSCIGRQIKKKLFILIGG